MKIRKTLVFLSLCSFVMSGCQSQITGIYVDNNYDVLLDEEPSYFQNITLDDLFLKIENKESFPFLYYSRGCSLCDEAEDTLSSYFKKIKQPFLLYRLTTDNRIQEEMMVRYPSYFARIGAPELFMFEAGKPIIDLTYDTLSNYNKFYTRNHKRFKRQNVDFLTKVSTFATYMESASDILVYFYDSTNKEEVSFYQSNIEKRARTSEKHILKLDKNYINSEDLRSFYTYFNIDTENYTPVLVDYKNNNDMRYVNYLNEEENSKTILDYFFRK